MRVGGIFTMFDIGASALRAERARMNVHANNLANVGTTHDQDGNLATYRRQRVFFKEGSKLMTGSNKMGVEVDRIESDFDSQFNYKYDPDHPDAIQEGQWAGYVEYPNVQPALEMVDMMIATRAYEANLTSLESAKQVFRGALRIIA